MKTIVFIHGMFQNAKSWEKWIAYFTERGYNCIAPSWPQHEGEPAQLRENPPYGLGDLSLDNIVAKMEAIVAEQPEKPIVIGHSVGGLVVQLLAAKSLIGLGVPVSSVAPNMMMTMDWDFFKNSMSISNPLKGNQPFYMDEKGFHETFANSLDEATAKTEYERTAVHDSRNVLRDCMMEAKVDMELPHAPLLFIAGEKDKIIPYELVEKNSKAYKDDSSITDYKLFENRSHYICNEPGWEEITGYIDSWLKEHEMEIADAPFSSNRSL